METSMNKVAAFIACAIWADGKIDEAEKVAVGEIAEALDYKEEEFASEVDKAIAEIKDYDDEKLNQYLAEAAVDIDEKDANTIFECALEVVLVDGVLDHDEVGNLLAMADALGIDAEDAVLMLADMIKDEPEIQVELN